MFLNIHEYSFIQCMLLEYLLCCCGYEGCSVFWEPRSVRHAAVFRKGTRQRYFGGENMGILPHLWLEKPWERGDSQIYLSRKLPSVPLPVAYGESGKQRAEVVGRHPRVLGSKEVQEETDKLCLREFKSSAWERSCGQRLIGLGPDRGVGFSNPHLP